MAAPVTVRTAAPWPSSPELGESGRGARRRPIGGAGEREGVAGVPFEASPESNRQRGGGATAAELEARAAAALGLGSGREAQERAWRGGGARCGGKEPRGGGIL